MRSPASLYTASATAGFVFSCAADLSDGQLQDRLIAVASFVDGGGLNYCEVPRVAGDDLTWNEFDKQFRNRPVVLTGVLKNMQSSLWTRDVFLHDYGHLRVKTNNGHFDHLRSKEVLNITTYISKNSSVWNLFFADHAYLIQAAVLNSLKPHGIPALLDGFDARPILSLGVAGSSTRFHSHAETWQMLLAGYKAWWLANDDKVVLPTPIEGDGDPCAALPSVLPRAKSSRNGTRLCVQHPGDIFFFGNQTPHATCNLADFVLGVGAQGRSDAWPPLHRAAWRGDVKASLQLIESSDDLDARDVTASSPLHRAVIAGHLPVAKLLVGAGADLRMRDQEGKHPLLMAAERGNDAMLNFLAESGAPLRRGDKKGVQPIHWAALSGHGQTIDYLLERRASVRATDKAGTEPAHWAALESDVQTIDRVAARGGDVHASSKSGIRPIHWAAGVGHEPIVSYLLASRSEPSSADAQGLTPLHFAAAQARLSVIRSLVDGRANLLARAEGHGGVTPGHAAAAMGHAAALEVLAKCGTDLSSRDAQGATPTQVAMKAGHLTALRMLTAHVTKDDNEGGARTARSTREL